MEIKAAPVADRAGEEVMSVDPYEDWKPKMTPTNPLELFYEELRELCKKRRVCLKAFISTSSCVAAIGPVFYVSDEQIDAMIAEIKENL